MAEENLPPTLRDANPGTSEGDRTLLLRLQGGDEDAATQLYLRYAKRLHALARAKTAADLGGRVDPEDLVQSIFRTFFRRAAKGEYDVPEGEELWKLLLVIGLNKIRATGTHHRAAKRDVRQTVSIEEHHQSAAGKQGADAEALLVLRLVVEELMNQLPPTSRQILEFRIEGYEVAQIAKMVKRSKRSVERILQEFRGTLRSMIQVED